MRLLVAVIFSIAIFSQCNTKQETAQWRGPERNGIYPDKNLLTQWPDSGPKLLWRFDSLGQGYSTVAVTSKKIYTVGTIDSISYVFSFDHKGSLLWKKELGKDWTKNWPGIRSTPIIYNGLGYVLNGFGVLYCFDAENGSIVWSKDMVKDLSINLLEFGLCENLVVDGDKVFYTSASNDADAVALNRKTGELIWKTKGNNDSTAYSSPILIKIADKKYYINQTSKRLFSVNAETGEIAWEYKIKGYPMPNTIMFRNGYLFAVDSWKNGSFILKISDDGKSYTEAWRSLDIGPQQGDVVVLGDRGYGMGGDGKRFMCFDWNTGKEIYSDSTRSQIVNVISAENLLYCYGLRGTFNLLKPTDKGFESLGSFRIKGGSNLHCSHPVIFNQHLFIRHDNSLFVYDIAKV